jgi:hypothetical protein
VDQSKMSKWAIRAAFCTLFIALVVLAFGHGFNLGKTSQLTMESALNIGKSNYKCEMVKR